MAKQGGLGANFYASGFDVSGDTNELTNIHGGPKAWDTTDITQLAHSRLGLLREGEIAWRSFFDPAVGAEHAAFSGLPTTDIILTAFMPPLLIGSPAISQVSKLVQYETKRPIAGELTVDFACPSNGFTQEWGLQLTAGKRTDTAATNGASNNDGAATSLGAQFYLQAFSLTGTDVTVTIQDSADNATWANVTGGGFTQIISGNLPPLAQRLQLASNATLRQYVRAITTTTGGFTSFTFAVQYSRNLVATAF